MRNHRPMSDLHNSKSTNKHPTIVFPNITDILPIKKINISDKDKFGDIIYTGSSGGTREKNKQSYSYRLESLKPQKTKHRAIYYKRFKRIVNISTSFGIVTFIQHFNKPQVIGKIITKYKGVQYRIVAKY